MTGNKIPQVPESPFKKVGNPVKHAGQDIIAFLTKQPSASSVAAHNTDTPTSEPAVAPMENLSLVYDMIIPGRQCPGCMEEAVSTIFEDTKMTLKVVEITAGIYPPLKIVVKGFLGVIDIVVICGFHDVS